MKNLARLLLAPALTLALALATAILAGAGARAAFAFDTTETAAQLHFRTGRTSTSFTTNKKNYSSGSVDNSYALNFEYEAMLSPTRSFTVQTLLGYDGTQGQMTYTDISIGWRYYVWGAAATAYLLVDGGNEVSRTPKFRVFLGPEIGVSQATFKVFTSELSVNSYQIGAAASAGAIYQLSKNFGAELLLGYGFGYSISPISASTTTLRTLIGLSMYF